MKEEYVDHLPTSRVEAEFGEASAPISLEFDANKYLSHLSHSDLTEEQKIELLGNIFSLSGASSRWALKATSVAPSSRVR